MKHVAIFYEQNPKWVIFIFSYFCPSPYVCCTRWSYRISDRSMPSGRWWLMSPAFGWRCLGWTSLIRCRLRSRWISGFSPICLVDVFDVCGLHSYTCLACLWYNHIWYNHMINFSILTRWVGQNQVGRRALPGCTTSWFTSGSIRQLLEFQVTFRRVLIFLVISSQQFLWTDIDWYT